MSCCKQSINMLRLCMAAGGYLWLTYSNATVPTATRSGAVDPRLTRPHAAHTLDLGLPGGSLNAFAGAIE